MTVMHLPLGQLTFTKGSEVTMAKAMMLAHAFAALLREGGEAMPKIVMGGDARPYTDEFLPPMTMAAKHGGAHVHHMVSPCTEDQLRFLIGSEFMDAGLYITGQADAMNRVSFVFLGPDCERIESSHILRMTDLINDAPLPQARGALTPCDLRSAHNKFMVRVLAEYGVQPWSPNPERPPLRIAVDITDGPAGSIYQATMRKVDSAGHVKLHPVHFPLTPIQKYDLDERTKRMTAHLRATKSDLGLSWSSDGTILRVVTGAGPVPPVYIGALLSRICAARWPGGTVIADHRTVLPYLRVAQRDEHLLRTCLPHEAEPSMRTLSGSFAGSVEGAYFFRETWWGPSGVLAACLLTHMAHLMSEPLADILVQMQNLQPVQGPVVMSNIVDPVAVVKAVHDVVSKAPEKIKVATDLTYDGALVLRSCLTNHDWRITVTPGPGTVTLYGEAGDGSTPTVDLMSSVKEQLSGLLRAANTGEKLI